MKDVKKDPLDTLALAIKTVRDILLLVGGIFIVIYFLPMLKDLRTRLQPENVQELSIGPISLKLSESIKTFAPPSVPIEANMENAIMLEKGSLIHLQETLRLLRTTKNARVDVLLVVRGKPYSGDLLQKYVSLLNIKFVVFQSTKMDGWIDAGSFNGQIYAGRTYSYDELKHEITGISYESTEIGTSTGEVLKKMQMAHLDNIVVVNETGKFDFMASRVDVLSRVVTSVILQEKTE